MTKNNIKTTKTVSTYTRKEIPIRDVHGLPHGCEAVSDEVKFFEGNYHLVSTYKRTTRLSSFLPEPKGEDLIDNGIEDDMVFILTSRDD